MFKDNNAKWLIEKLTESITLNEWETNFVDSIAFQFEKLGRLSKKQVDKLQDIYEKDETRT